MIPRTWPEPTAVRRRALARRRAALLLEAMLALALLATASALLAGVVRDSSARLDRSLDRAAAADLARAAIARIEGGLATPETLNGPAPAWDPAVLLTPDNAAMGAPDSDDIPITDAPLTDPDWRLAIETQPSPYDGLTLVSITASRTTTAGVSFTFHQLVRLEAPAHDEVGDTDELAELIEREQEAAARGEATP